MYSSRAAQQSLRRLAFQHPTNLRFAVSKLTPRAAVATGNLAQIRQAATTASDADVAPADLLAKQRLRRPVSPHLTIYKPQITWYPSMFHRITGCVLSGGLYIFATAYLVSPLLGWHLESASLAASFGALPLAAKFAMKFGVALPFTFHSMNGVRHLVFDLGKQLSNKQVSTTGWAVVGLSTAGALALALL